MSGYNTVPQMAFKTLLVLLLFTAVAYGNDSQSYADGKGFSEVLQSTLSLSDGTDVPYYNGEDVEETQLRASELSELAARQTNDPKDTVGSSVLDAQRTVLEYDDRAEDLQESIDAGNEAIKDPLAIIGGTVSTKKTVSEIIETTHTCEESAEAREYTCVRERVLHPDKSKKKNNKAIWLKIATPLGTYYSGSYEIIPNSISVVEVDVGQTITYQTVSQFRSIPIDRSLIQYAKDLSDWGKNWFLQNEKGFVWQFGISNGNMHWNAPYIVLPVEFNVPDGLDQRFNKTQVVLEDAPDGDSISDSCKSLEAMTDKGLCRYGDVRTIEGPGYRTISYEGQTLRVYRDWWKKEFTYVCKAPSKNNCEPFRKQGCERIDSVCIEREGDVCVNHRKTYLCRTKSKGFEVTGFEGDVPFCLDGNCDDHSWTDNKDFADAMSKMSIFKEMQDDMDAKEATVFKGNEHQCNKDVLGFQDCCQGGGWGDGVGIAKKCSSSEQELRELKDQKKCVYVGTYCAEKVLGICVRKKQSYCCFGSKLSKLVQEQGRQQLGIEWGSSKHPNCRPLTVEEIQAIDFSQIDLSELFADLLQGSNLNNLASSTKQMSSKWSAKIKTATPIKKAKSEKQTYAYFGLEGEDASL